MAGWVEVIKYYAIPDFYGTEAVFTLVCSDYLYTNIVDGASAQNLMPWSKMRIPFAYCTNQTLPGTLFSSLEALGAQLNFHVYAVPTRTTIYDSFILKDNRGIKYTRRDFRGYTPSSRFYDSAHQYDQTNNYLPVGVITYGSTINSWAVQLFVCTENMSSYKLVQVNYNSGAVSFKVLGSNNISYFSLSQFFSDIEPIPTPTPGGDDPDPYDKIDGEADLPGDSSLDLPSEPTTSPVDSGLFSLFAPSTTQMRSLADYLWTDFAGASDSIPEMLGEIVEALKRSVSNPLNSIFGLSIIASQGLPTGNSSSVHVGFWDTGISMPRISKQYFTVDCGSLSFEPVCGNTFLDYAPYSKFTIFLPYVGMRILDANDVVGHTISVIYRGDCVSGALVCFIKRDGKIIAEHSGNCALNLPLSADSWANTISSAARIALSGDIAPAMAGLSIGSASGAVKVAAAVATNPSALAPQVGQSGAVAGSSGHMGSQKPFILREAVRFHSTEGFNSIIGYPAFYYRKLGDCRGFTQCLDVHLNHTPATGDELKEIEELLKQGVII